MLPEPRAVRLSQFALVGLVASGFGSHRTGRRTKLPRTSPDAASAIGSPENGVLIRPVRDPPPGGCVEGGPAGGIAARLAAGFDAVARFPQRMTRWLDES